MYFMGIIFVPNISAPVLLPHHYRYRDRYRNRRFLKIPNPIAIPLPIEIAIENNMQVWALLAGCALPADFAFA